MRSDRPRIGFVVASPITVSAFLALHIERLSRTFDISLFLNTSGSSLTGMAEKCRIEAIPIERDISVPRDIAALSELYRKLRRDRLSLVFSQTPKAGLLTGLAAFAARVPVRIHCFTGQVWATRKGLPRAILMTADRVIAALATHTLADSASQREFLISNGIVAPEKIQVLAHGSICGVDVERFKPNSDVRASIRRDLAIPLSANVFLFVGRLNREKGIPELAAAFAQVAARQSSTHLLLVGPDEGNLATEVKSTCAAILDRVHIVGQTSRPEDFMAAADVLCLPSHREGFGSVIIEAAASGIPAIGTRIYGVSDAIVDGETGLLVDVKDVTGLAGAIEKLARGPELVGRLAQAARKRALEKFCADVVVSAMEDFIKTLALKDGHRKD